MAVKMQEWRAELYELAAAVDDADAALYEAVGTDAEAEALAAYNAAKARYRDAERSRVGVSYKDDCGRCGGAGGADAWRFTGWTCYECGGSGFTYRTWTKMRFRKDPRKRRAEDDERAAEYAERDRAFAANVADLGEVGRALVEAKERFDAFCRAYEHSAEEPEEPGHEVRFRAELASKLHRYGSLTEAQIAAVERGLSREAEKEAEQARAQAAGAFQRGRMTVEGVVVSFKDQKSQFGMTLKMLVKLDDGRKLYGTVPRSLYGEWDDEGVRSGNAEVGSRVRFSAEVEPSRDDATFGFFKRPTGAELVAEEA